MNEPEKFEDIMHEQFSIREEDIQSSAETFPLLNPGGRVGSLAVHLQLDAAHGTVSSIVVGQSIENKSELAYSANELAKLRLNTFQGLYSNVQQLLEDPGDEPEIGILHFGEYTLTSMYPGESAGTTELIQWAVSTGCRQSLDVIDEMPDVSEGVRNNLRELVNEAYVTYLMKPDENFQELVG